MGQPFVSVINLGCRVNRVECDRISEDLVRAGLVLVDPDEADLIVINTCAVTGEAEAKTRKAVRHALARPGRPLVIATGCAANLHPEMFEELSGRVTVERMKSDIAQRACELLDRDAQAPGAPVDPAAVARLLGRSRLGIKVQDGCNNRCSYCIVWKARGPERSVPVEAVLERARVAEAAGVPEVVLTGVNLGAYDGASATDSHVEIDELLGAILRETAVPHVRLSSLEPMDVDERLLRVMAANPERVAPFLHLPLQSGCTETLERMGRPYTAEEFLDLTRRIRAILPAAALSCDLIVGFPGETDEEFACSLETCRRAGFARMHVFRYSARPGTLAAEAPDQVDPRVMAVRSREARELAEQMARADALSRVGTTERAVLERGRAGTLGSFHRVIVDDAPDSGIPALVSVGIIGMDAEGALHARIDAARSAAREELDG